MLLNHYTACLEKHVRGELASLINEKGLTKAFEHLGYQTTESLQPMILHQVETVVLGSDNAPETGESYCLKKEITAGLNVALTRSVVDNDDGSRSSIAVLTCTNISSAPITVGEVGLRRYVRFSNYSDYILFDRTPLGTPLTIQPGEVGRIVYTITMS